MFLAFALPILLTAIVFSQNNVTLPLDLTSSGMTPATFGLVLSVNGVALEVPVRDREPGEFTVASQNVLRLFDLVNDPNAVPGERPVIPPRNGPSGFAPSRG